MGLVNKLKNILFEEEEVEIPVIEKKEKKSSLKELPKKEENVYKETFYDDEAPVINEAPVVPNPVVEKEETVVTVSEKETFKSEKTFNFPAFDEEEFESVMPPKKSTNVMEYERRKPEKKEYTRSFQREVVRVEEKPRFKPSPIISPVYGILDKNYTPDEITTRDNTVSANAIDVDSVRKKAFGSLDNKEKKEEKEEVIITNYDDDILEEEKIKEEKLEKARTIDELLKDSSDEVIDIDDVDVDTSIEDTFEDLPVVEALEDENKEHEPNFEEDTLESDLFDLIDSMYDNREDGE